MREGPLVTAGEAEAGGTYFPDLTLGLKLDVSPSAPASMKQQQTLYSKCPGTSRLKHRPLELLMGWGTRHKQYPSWFLSTPALRVEEGYSSTQAGSAREEV